MALSPEVLTSPFVATTHECLNMKEMVEGLLSEKHFIGNFVHVYCTLNMDLSLYLSPSSPSFHSMELSLQWLLLDMKIRACITAGPYPREHCRWTGLLHLPRMLLSVLLALADMSQECKIFPMYHLPQGKV